MTGLTSHSHMPGRVLLKLAKAIFNQQALETVVIPVLADLQREVQEAGDNRTMGIERSSARLLRVLEGRHGGSIHDPDLAAWLDPVHPAGQERRQSPRRARRRAAGGHLAGAVSYTHLTLPTIYSV